MRLLLWICGTGAGLVLLLLSAVFWQTRDPENHQDKMIGRRGWR